MMTWRKLIYCAVLALILIVTFLSDHFIAVLLCDIGIVDIYTQAARAVVYAIGFGAVLGFLAAFVLWKIGGYRVSVGAAVFWFLFTCLEIYIAKGQIHSFYSDLRRRVVLDFPGDLSFLVSSGCLSALALGAGIVQLITLRRQQQAQPSSSIA